MFSFLGWIKLNNSIVHCMIIREKLQKKEISLKNAVIINWTNSLREFENLCETESKLVAIRDLSIEID